MAVITCPMCSTTLRIPDGVSGHVKCPKCSHLFPVKAFPSSASSGSIPAPEKPPAPAALPAASAKPTPARKATPAFEVVEERESSKKRSRSFDDDDEVEKRPKKKKKPRNYDSDDDLLHAAPKKGQGKGRVGLLLLLIASWLYFSMYVLFTLRAFVLLVGILIVDTSGRSTAAYDSTAVSNARSLASLIDFTMIVLGLLGLGNWVVSLIGLSFNIAGPERSRAPAIIAASVSGVQLLLLLLGFAIMSNSKSGLMIMGMNNMPLASSPWLIFSSTMIDVNAFIPSLMYSSKLIGGEYLVLILIGVCEMVRLFFVLITIRAMANFAKNNSAALKAQLGIVVTAIVLGAGVIGSAFLLVLLREARFSSLQTIATIAFLWNFLLCLAYTVMLIFPALTASSVYKSLGRRIR